MKIKINQTLTGLDGITPLSDKKENFPKNIYEKLLKVPENEPLTFSFDEVTAILKHLRGEIVITLRDICVNALLTPTEGDDEKKKFEKWEIFKKLRDLKDDEDIVELTAEEISVIKKGIGKVQAPLILGQCFEMLES